MADNKFSKEEVVAFENVLEGFQDALVMSKLVSKYQTDDRTMERANDIIWRPMPYNVPSYNGLDQSANFNSKTQLSVPATIGIHKSVPLLMDAIQLTLWISKEFVIHNKQEVVWHGSVACIQRQVSRLQVVSQLS